MYLSLLLTVSNEGAVKVWKNPHVLNEQCLVASWYASKLLTQKSAYGSTVCSDWIQQSGHLVVGGSVPKIRMWDVSTLQVTQELPSSLELGVNSIHSTSNASIIVGGGRCGNTCIYDRRAKNSQVRHLHRHLGKVVGVKWQRRGESNGVIVSASKQGDVAVCDPRMSGAVRCISAHSSNSPLNAFAVHDYCPIIATGSVKQFVKIFDISGKQLKIMKYHDGFLGQRIGPIISLAFHPHKLHLATGATDSMISLHKARSSTNLNPKGYSTVANLDMLSTFDEFYSSGRGVLKIFPNHFLF